MFNMPPIGHIRCDFKEKFGIPRQAGISPSVSGAIVLPNTRFNEDALGDLQGFSHIWVIFVFHDLKKPPDKARIRPPRLGGNKYVGVFSSRSPYRPNPIGLSLVELGSINSVKDEIEIDIHGHDLLDGTPVLDIKPYISSDQPCTEVQYGWQARDWDMLEVEFALAAEQAIAPRQELRLQIIDILKNDPRPAYKKGKNSSHGLTLGELNIQFSVRDKICTVDNIQHL